MGWEGCWEKDKQNVERFGIRDRQIAVVYRDKPMLTLRNINYRWYEWWNVDAGARDRALLAPQNETGISRRSAALQIPLQKRRIRNSRYLSIWQIWAAVKMRYSRLYAREHADVTDLHLLHQPVTGASHSYDDLRKTISYSG